MTAGGSHTATKWPQSGRMRGGRGFRRSTGQSLPLEGKACFASPGSAYEIRAGGACRRPYTQNRYCLPPLIRPPERVATFPQGKAISQSRQSLRRFLPLLHYCPTHQGTTPRGRLFLSPGRPFSKYTNASAGNFPVEALLYFSGIFPTFQPLIPTPRCWTWARHRYSCCPRPEPARRRFPG